MGIKLSRARYDPSEGGNLEFVEQINTGFERSERKAKKGLERLARDLDATHVFGVRYINSFGTYQGNGEAYRPKPKERTNPQPVPALAA